MVIEPILKALAMQPSESVPGATLWLCEGWEKDGVDLAQRRPCSWAIWDAGPHRAIFECIFHGTRSLAADLVVMVDYEGRRIGSQPTGGGGDE